MSAHLYREYTLRCNAKGCRAWYQAPRAADKGSRARVRKLAVRAGWTHVHEPGLPRSLDEDFCPDHKPQESK